MSSSQKQRYDDSSDDEVEVIEFSPSSSATSSDFSENFLVNNNDDSPLNSVHNRRSYTRRAHSGNKNYADLSKSEIKALSHQDNNDQIRASKCKYFFYVTCNINIVCF